MFEDFDPKALLIGIVTVAVIIFGASNIQGFKDKITGLIDGIQPQVQQAQQLVEGATQAVDQVQGITNPDEVMNAQ